VIKGVFRKPEKIYLKAKEGDGTQKVPTLKKDPEKLVTPQLDRNSPSSEQVTEKRRSRPCGIPSPKANPLPLTTVPLNTLGRPGNLNGKLRRRAKNLVSAEKTEAVHTGGRERKEAAECRQREVESQSMRKGRGGGSCIARPEEEAQE